MIQVENTVADVIQVTLPPKIKAEDFVQLEPQIDTLIDKYKTIRLLIDATGFEGWLTLHALREHVGFARRQQYYVNCIAVVALKFWQRAIINAIKVFVKPTIQVFHDKEEAQEWLSLMS